MAHLTPYRSDPDRYVEYYRNQAGSGLPGFIGSNAMYGSGIGGIFKSFFRAALPFLKRGFSIAKPHLKTAAKNIFGDVVTTALTKPYNNNNNNGQDGSGLMVMTRKSYRPPGVRVRRGSGRHVKKKTRSTSRKLSVAKRPRSRRVKKSTRTKRRTNTIF